MNSKNLYLASLAALLLLGVALISGCNRSYGNRVVDTHGNELTVTESDGEEQRTHEVAPDADITLDGEPANLTDLDRGDRASIKIETRNGKDVATEIDAESDELEADEAVEAEASPPAVREQEPNVSVDIRLPSPGATPLPQAEPLARETNESSGEAAEAPHADQAARADMSFLGRIANLADHQLIVKDEDGKEETFKVDGDTRYTIDGEQATLEDLKMEQMVHVTADRDGEALLAKTVDATRQ